MQRLRRAPCRRGGEPMQNLWSASCRTHTALLLAIPPGEDHQRACGGACPPRWASHTAQRGPTVGTTMKSSKRHDQNVARSPRTLFEDDCPREWREGGLRNLFLIRADAAPLGRRLHAPSQAPLHCVGASPGGLLSWLLWRSFTSFTWVLGGSRHTHVPDTCPQACTVEGLLPWDCA